MADGAPVVGAVVDQVVDHLVTSQHPVLSVHEREADALISLMRVKRADVVLQPLIRRHEATIELFQPRQFLGVRRSVRVGRCSQSRLEELFDPNHVVQLLKGERKGRRMDGAIDLGYGVQCPPVGPRLVLQWFLQEHGIGDERPWTGDSATRAPKGSATHRVTGIGQPSLKSLNESVLR